jgi:hypothetical protein
MFFLSPIIFIYFLSTVFSLLPYPCLFGLLQNKSPFPSPLFSLFWFVYLQENHQVTPIAVPAALRSLPERGAGCVLSAIPPCYRSTAWLLSS